MYHAATIPKYTMAYLGGIHKQTCIMINVSLTVGSIRWFSQFKVINEVCLGVWVIVIIFY